jgi:hypothetical protein
MICRPNAIPVSADVDGTPVLNPHHRFVDVEIFNIQGEDS